MCLGASLVAQWLRICLLVQETRVQSLIREDPMYCEKRNRFRYSRLESIQTDTWNTGSRFTVFLGLGFPGGSDSKESACNAGDPDSIPGSGRNPGEGNGYPLQYSCLENFIDRGAWRATVLGVTKRHNWATNTFTCLQWLCSFSHQDSALAWELASGNKASESNSVPVPSLRLRSP